MVTQDQIAADALAGVSDETAAEIAALPSDTRAELLSLVGKLDPTGVVSRMLGMLSPASGDGN